MDIAARGYTNPDLLWSPQTLRKQLEQPGLAVVDTRRAERGGPPMPSRGEAGARPPERVPDYETFLAGFRPEDVAALHTQKAR